MKEPHQPKHQHSLSKQQEDRLREEQQGHFVPGQEGSQLATTHKDEELGTICAIHKHTAEVCDRHGNIRLCHLRGNLGPLVIGDRVAWLSAGQDDGDGVVVAIQPRKQLLTRRMHRGDHLLAANLDRLLIVLAPEPEPTLELLDSLLVVAELAEIPSCILLNKIDLPSADNPALRKLLHTYRNCGYPLLEVSALSGEGMDELRNTLTSPPNLPGVSAVITESERELPPARISVLAGQSGVGKSTLINALGAGHAPTRPLSSDSHGTHTTTTPRLYKISQNGWLADLPGVRSFDILHLSTTQLERGFREFGEWLGKCKFRNCRHDKEPNCALREAAREEKISPHRWEQYQKFASHLKPAH